MKCPCCDKDLTPEVIERLRDVVARQQADPPAKGSPEAALLFSKVALLERIDRTTAVDRSG